MIRLRLFLLMQFLPLTVLAGAASPQGVWSGTVGKKAVIACFNKGSTWTAYGSYYYIDYLTPIALHTQEEDDSYWHEGDTGKWKLTTPVNGAIMGTWRNEKTGKTFPINLTLVDGKDDESACARDSFNIRLENRPKIKKGKIVQFSPGRSYRKIQFAGQETIELFSMDPAIDKLNTQLKPDLSTEAIDAYFQQRREFLGRVGYPAVDERHTEPKYWDSNFITIEFYLWVAGEGRRGISNEYRTWNLRTGEEVDLWNWIEGSSSNANLPPKLKEYLYRDITEESPDCSNGYRGEGIFTLTLGKTGLNIDEDAWGDGCEKMFFIPYQELGPFLSPTGKQAVNSILGLK